MAANFVYFESMFDSLFDSILQVFGSPSPLFSWVVLSVCLVSTLGLCIFILRFLPISKSLYSNIVSSLGALALVMMVIEAGLRISGVTINYTEKRLGHYVFLRHGSYRDTLHTWYPNEEHTLGDPSIFTYHRSTNSLGLSDVEWETEKPDGVFRIVALGDSFTEGDGAPADSTWPKFLYSHFEALGIPVEVLNAGVCGSDPFYELMLLKLKLLEYSPDLVLVTISMQDLREDCAVRGGMRRFDPTRGRMPSVFEIVYGYSHFARLIYNRVLKYSWMLIRFDEHFLNFMNNEVIPEMFSFFKQIQQENPDTKIVPVYYPHQLNLYIDELPELQITLQKEALENGFELVSLRPCYQRMIEANGDDHSTYWWQGDGHHNAKGYQIMASCIAETIEPWVSNPNDSLESD